MKAADAAIRNALARSIFDLVADHRGHLLTEHAVEVRQTTLLTAMVTIQAATGPERCFVVRMSELVEK